MSDVKEIEMVKAVDFVLEVLPPLPTGPVPRYQETEGGAGRPSFSLRGEGG
jgi:hypothetical protein